MNSIESAQFSRKADLDNSLQETYPVHKTDKENQKLAEERIRQLEKGSRKISSAVDLRDVGVDREVRSRDRRRSGSDIQTLGRGITRRFIQIGKVKPNRNKGKEHGRCGSDVSYMSD